MARSALVELCSEGASEESTGVQLLGAIREIFTQEGEDKISTKDLLEALIARDNGEPWAIWWERDVKDGKTRGPGGKDRSLFEAIRHHSRENSIETILPPHKVTNWPYLRTLFLAISPGRRLFEGTTEQPCIHAAPRPFSQRNKRSSVPFSKSPAEPLSMRFVPLFRSFPSFREREGATEIGTTY